MQNFIIIITCIKLYKLRLHKEMPHSKVLLTTFFNECMQMKILELYFVVVHANFADFYDL